MVKRRETKRIAMGYMNIPNLYTSDGQKILLFREGYAAEKVHGTSTHVTWKNGAISFFAGGCKHEQFVSLFDVGDLASKAQALGIESWTVFGEGYGGKMQGMSKVYGKDLRFIAFDARIGDVWLDVPKAEKFATDLGFEFVPWEYGPLTLEWLDSQRDKPSEVAARRGIVGPREGIVIRSPIEVRTNNGARIIAKYKADVFRETAKPRVVRDPALLTVLSCAEDIAAEWVTEMRLSHVLDQFGPQLPDITQTGKVIKAMLADVVKESKGEIDWTNDKAIEKAVAKATAKLFKKRLKTNLGMRLRSDG